MMSLFPDHLTEWNLNKLNPIHSAIHSPQVKYMEGLKKSFVYFGRPFTTFSCHVEDINLNAASYLHWGAEKIWYGIPENDSEKLETKIKELIPTFTCDLPLRHKNTLPVTWCGAYHFGMNIGDNIAEASNFGLDGWLEEYAPKFKQCNCELKKKPRYCLKELEKSHIKFRNQRNDMALRKRLKKLSNGKRLQYFYSVFQNQELTSECFKCKKSSPKLQSLTRHLATHTNYRIVCKLCKQYSRHRESDIKTHFKIKHKNKNWEKNCTKIKIKKKKMKK